MIAWLKARLSDRWFNKHLSVRLRISTFIYRQMQVHERVEIRNVERNQRVGKRKQYWRVWNVSFCQDITTCHKCKLR